MHAKYTISNLEEKLYNRRERCNFIDNTIEHCFSIRKKKIVKYEKTVKSETKLKQTMEK